MLAPVIGTNEKRFLFCKYNLLWFIFVGTRHALSRPLVYTTLQALEEIALPGLPSIP